MKWVAVTGAPDPSQCLGRRENVSPAWPRMAATSGYPEPVPAGR
jgi:hypothetical protein